MKDVNATAHAVTARKRHVCDECLSLIGIGERHVRSVVFPGHDANGSRRPWARRLCATCADRFENTAGLLTPPLLLGSLFTGYGGLDAAVNAFFGSRTAWVCDNDSAPSRLLHHHHPDVPNLGDITKVDWATVPKVQILTGGFPCQDLSHAGKQAGLMEGTRSGLWSYMAQAIQHLRPEVVVIENVRGILSARAHSPLEFCPGCMGDDPDRVPLRALGCVLGDLADIGYDARWTSLRAADVGGAHGRLRVFIVAKDAHRAARG